MSILTTEIKCYGSANMQDGDSGAQGGGISLTKKVEFTDIAATDVVDAVSSQGADTMNLTIVGRDAAGVIQTETKALTGTTPKAFTTSFERILKATLPSAAAGTVTITRHTGGATIMTLEPGILECRRPFYNAAAPPSGTRDYYEKIFMKNTNGSLTLTEAQLIEQGDPSGKISFAMEDALDDNGTSTNRLTAPAGITGSFDSTTKDVIGQNLGPGVAQGIWLKLSLAVGDYATKTSYTLRALGHSI